ncbi:MAG: hypothetical protein ACRECH_11630 [Nitrososphaerales archaeon]
MGSNVATTIATGNFTLNTDQFSTVTISGNSSGSGSLREAAACLLGLVH